MRACLQWERRTSVKLLLVHPVSKSVKIFKLLKSEPALNDTINPHQVIARVSTRYLANCLINPLLKWTTRSKGGALILLRFCTNGPQCENSDKGGRSRVKSQWFLISASKYSDDSHKKWRDDCEWAGQKSVQIQGTYEAQKISKLLKWFLWSLSCYCVDELTIRQIVGGKTRAYTLWKQVSPDCLIVNRCAPKLSVMPCSETHTWTTDRGEAEGDRGRGKHKYAMGRGGENCRSPKILKLYEHIRFFYTIYWIWAKDAPNIAETLLLESWHGGINTVQLCAGVSKAKECVKMKAWSIQFG